MTNKQAAIQIIGSLHKAGFEALLAGGCVRDMLLGNKPKDYERDAAGDMQNFQADNKSRSEIRRNNCACGERTG